MGPEILPARALAAALLLVAGSGAACAEDFDWPAVPLPANSTGERVTDHMKNNGLDMRASRFATPRSLDEVVQFYRKKWPGKHVVDTLGNKTIVGHVEGDYYVTVTLTSASGATKGTIGTMKMPTEKIEYVMGEGFDRPPHTEVFNDIWYYDSDTPTRTLGLANDLAPYQNYQYYVRHLRGDGWRLQKGKPCVMPSRACAAMFEKPDGSHLAMTIERNSGELTRIVVNIR